MSDIMEQIFQVTSQVKKAFLAAQEDLQKFGVLQPETKNIIAELCQNREQVVTELSSWFLYTKGKLDGLRAEYKTVRDAMDANENELKKRLEFIKNCISHVLPPSREAQVVNDKAYVFYKRSTKVSVPDASLVPMEYLALTTSPDISKIEELLEKEQPSWAFIEENWTAQIKPGGERALKNAKNRLKRLENGVGEDEQD